MVERDRRINIYNVTRTVETRHEESAPNTEKSEHLPYVVPEALPHIAPEAVPSLPGWGRIGALADM